MNMLRRFCIAFIYILIVFSLIKCAGNNGSERLDDIKRQERATGNYC